VYSRTPEVKGQKIKLSKVFENKKYEGAGIEYEYDFGDCWTHEIEVVGKAPATNKFVCMEGVGHGVLEDVGSVKGWLKLRQAYQATSPTQEQRGKMRWAESRASNADPRGLGDGRDRFWDKDAINLRLVTKLSLESGYSTQY
jgi:hypothetical protein